MAARDRQNPRRHRRRKQRRLTRRGRALQDRVEVVGKAHVQHLVGFVEHEDAKLVELQRLAPHVIERAARRGDDDGCAALERADLRMHRSAAVQRQHAEADAFRVFVDRLGHLHRQLARGHEDQPARMSRRGLAGGDDLQHRQSECGRLARAGLRLPEQVAAAEQQRDRFTLHGRRLFVTEGGHDIGEFRSKSKCGKRDRSVRGRHSL